MVPADGGEAGRGEPAALKVLAGVGLLDPTRAAAATDPVVHSEREITLRLCRVVGGSLTPAVTFTGDRVGLGGYKTSGRLRLSGEFLGDGRWIDSIPRADTAFREAAARSGYNWPWWAFLERDSADEVQAFLETYRAELAKHQRWG